MTKSQVMTNGRYAGEWHSNI